MQHQPEQHPPGNSGVVQTTAPVMALRTYTALRLGSVGVIAVLTVAIIREYDTAGHCLQGSISAYYFTSVQSVFVGTLLTLGLVMIVLWGKTAFEDGVLNLAGLLAPVVAFVPTKDTNKCGLTDATGGGVTTTQEKHDVIKANYDAITNNMFAYLAVVGAIIVVVAVVGAVAYAKQWEAITLHPVAFWAPLALALVFWLFIGYKFLNALPWIRENAHEFSAKTMFGLIILVVLNVGVQKWSGKHETNGKQPRWAFAYWTLAALMLIGAVAIPALAESLGDQFDSHRTFWLEAWEIGLLAVFWGLQTADRWKEGAPPRTRSEEARSISGNRSGARRA
jgi:hypothetical protein